VSDPTIRGRVELEDGTGEALSSIESGVTSSFKNMSTVAGGIIQAEFSRNVVGALEDVGRTATERAAAFESATARIIAASGLEGAEAQALKSQLEETARALGVEYGTGATQAMEATEALVKAGLEGEEATKALAGVLQLAAIEGIDTASAANLVVQAMTMYGLSAEEATRVVDGFVKSSAAGIDTATGYASGLSNVGATAANMGLSLEETMAALVQLDNTFGGAVESGTFLNRMLLDVVAKADAAGLSIYNADGSMKGLDEIVNQMRATLAGFGGDQAAANEWLGQFDTRAQKAIIGLVNYDGSVSETQAGLEGMAGAQEQVNVILDTYEGKLAIVNAEKENAAIKTGELTSSISLFGAQLTAGLGPIGLFADALGPPMLTGVMQQLTVSAIPKLVGLIGSAGPLGLAVVGVGAAVAGLALAWENNWFGIRDITKGVVDTLTGWFEGVQDWLGGLGKAWSDFWSGARREAQDSTSTIQSSTSAMQRAMGGAERYAEDLGEGVYEATVKMEYGESPGGIRDVVAATERMRESWNRSVGGLRTIPDLGMGPHTSTVSGGGGGLTMVFEKGSIVFNDARLDSVMGRERTASDLAERLGKEVMLRR